MAILQQKQGSVSIYMGWYGLCDKPCSNFSLIKSDVYDKIFKVFQVKDLQDNYNAFDGTVDLSLQPFTNLECGKAYTIILKPGTESLEIEHFVQTTLSSQSSGRLSSDCVANTDCCEAFDNTYNVTSAVSSSVETFTERGFSITGFQENGFVCYYDLDLTQSDPGKVFQVADKDFNIVGTINTEFKILNNYIRYTDIEGLCWEANLEENPPKEYNELTLVGAAPTPSPTPSPTPTPTPVPVDCCTEYDLEIEITNEIANGSFTSGGMTIFGFNEGGVLCIDRLDNTKSDPGKVYSAITQDMESIIGGINTEFEIVNRVCRYKENGECYEFTLEGTGSELNIIRKI